MKKLLQGIFITVLVGISSSAIADDIATASIEKAIDAGFSELERQLIGKYLGKQETMTQAEENTDQPKAKKTKSKGKKGKKGQPPGLAKKDKLPPGLEKLKRNGSLPPGLAKRDLPEDLEQQLPPPPQGYERKVIEDAAVVLVHKATGKIADIIKDVVIGN